MDSQPYRWATASSQVTFTVLAFAQQLLMKYDAVNQTWETSTELCSTILFS